MREPLRGDVPGLLAAIIEAHKKLCAKHKTKERLTLDFLKRDFLPKLEFAVDATLGGESSIGDIVYVEQGSNHGRSDSMWWYNQDGTGSYYNAPSFVRLGNGEKVPYRVIGIHGAKSPIPMLSGAINYGAETECVDAYFQEHYKDEFDAWAKQTTALVARAGRLVAKFRKNKRQSTDFGQALLEDIEKNVKASESTAQQVQEIVSTMDPDLLQKILRLPPAVTKYLSGFLGRRSVSLENLNQESLIQMQKDLQVKKILAS